MNETSKLNSDFGSILISCKTLPSNVQSYTISNVKRQSNLIAHSLARASKLYASSQVFNFTPTCITTILMNEMH